MKDESQLQVRSKDAESSLILSSARSSLAARGRRDAEAIDRQPDEREHPTIGKYRRLAEAGDAGAQYELGSFYDEGCGVAQDYVEAARWWRKSAEQGHVAAQFSLGSIYYNGQGVVQDYAEAVKWFREAADQGDAAAQFNLGMMFREGQGVDQDHVEAVTWFRMAAEQGHAEAQNCVGYAYASGFLQVPEAHQREHRGERLDYEEAARWWRKAAEQDHPGAQFNLGMMYADGKGVPQDYVEAYKMLSFAVANSSEQDRARRSEKRDIVAMKLTSEQLAAAQRMVTEALRERDEKLPSIMEAFKESLRMAREAELEA